MRITVNPSFSVRRRAARGLEMRMSVYSIRALGMPLYIMLLWSEREQALFVAAADEPADYTVRVTEKRLLDHYDQRIPTAFARRFIDKAGMSDDYAFNVVGAFDEETGMVCFRMRDAQRREFTAKPRAARPKNKEATE